MSEIIQLNQYRADPKAVTNDVTELSKKDVHKVEQIRDSIAVSYTHLTLPTIYSV